MQERKRLGHIMFRVDGGIVNDSQVDLFTDPDEAKDCAKLIIEDCYERDRYANPEHPDYDDQYAEQSREEYEERFEDAENLRNVGLNTDDDLVFLEVYTYQKVNPIARLVSSLFRLMKS